MFLYELILFIIIVRPEQKKNLPQGPEGQQGLWKSMGICHGIKKVFFHGSKPMELSQQTFTTQPHPDTSQTLHLFKTELGRKK